MAGTAEDLRRLQAITRELELREARCSLLKLTTHTKPDYEVSWHHSSICSALDGFAAGKIPRLIIMAPPRHGKSELVSRRLPPLIFGQDPDAQIIAASYSSDLSSRMNRDVQRIMDTPLYQELFPNTRLFGKNIRSVAQGSWLRNNEIFEIVGHKGVYRSAGVGGGITGMGANFAIIDDPIKDQAQADSISYREAVWEWYTSTLYTRLEKGGSVLLTLTRWHEDDLAGRLLELAKSDPTADQWMVIRYEAIRETVDDAALDDGRKLGEALWPNKYDLKRLGAIRSSVGTRVWNALFQQRPTALAGSLIKRSWLKFYRKLPERFDELVTSWDMTFKDSDGSDYVVGSAYGRHGADIYLIDQVRDRMDFPATLKAFEAFAKKHRYIACHLVEDKANGPAIISMLKRKIPGIIPVEPNGDKVARLSACSPDYEAGNVYYPDPSIASWINDHINEMVNFPKWPKRDRVDAESQAINRLRGRNVGTFTAEMAKPTGRPMAGRLGDDD